MLWQLYDQITATTLLMRGAQSVLLSAATAQAMTQRVPELNWWNWRVSAMHRRSWRRIKW
jgi:hypothetical protein